MVRRFLNGVIFVPSRETPVEIRLYMRKLSGKHDGILLVLVSLKRDASLIVHTMREVCNNSIFALGIAFCRFVG